MQKNEVFILSLFLHRFYSLLCLSVLLIFLIIFTYYFFKSYVNMSHSTLTDLTLLVVFPILCVFLSLVFFWVTQSLSLNPFCELVPQLFCVTQSLSLNPFCELVSQLCEHIHVFFNPYSLYMIVVLNLFNLILIQMLRIDPLKIETTYGTTIC